MTAHDPLSPLLPAALDVLDRADARASELRALVEASGTAHPPEILNQALADHLAVHSPVSLPADPQATPFAWGWARPLDESHRGEALTQLQKVITRQRKRRAWRWLPVSLFAGAGVYLLHAGLWRIADPHSTIREVPFTGWIAGAMVMILPTLGLDQLLSWRWESEETERAASHLRPVGTEVDLPSPLEAYLARPACRAYLRAVLQSGLPELLVRDVHRLEELQQQAVREDQRQAQKVLRAKEAQEAQARAALRPQRMAIIARALEAAP